MSVQFFHILTSDESKEEKLKALAARHLFSDGTAWPQQIVADFQTTPLLVERYQRLKEKLDTEEAEKKKMLTDAA